MTDKNTDDENPNLDQDQGQVLNDDSNSSTESDQDQEQSSSTDVDNTESDGHDNSTDNTSDDDEENLRIDKTIEREERSLWRNTVLSLVLIGSLGAGIGGAFLYDSYQRDQDAVNELNEVTESRGEITMVNSDVVNYGGGDEDSYALGVDSAVGSGDAPDFGTFIIGNENGEYEQVVNLYLDYADPRSRDFFFMNQQMLQSLVENGQIELRIHPVPSFHPYSMYAAEALAQTAHRHPGSFWSVNTSLLQLNDEVASIDEEVSASVFGEMIENELTRYHNIDDIDNELIIEGMFFDWLGAISEDEMLTSGGVPPIIYSDGNLLDSESYYDTEELRENIINAESGDSTENTESPAEEGGENGDADEESEAEIEEVPEEEG